MRPGSIEQEWLCQGCAGPSRELQTEFLNLDCSAWREHTAHKARTTPDATLSPSFFLHKTAILLCHLKDKTKLLGLTVHAALLNVPERLTCKHLFFQVSPSPDKDKGSTPPGIPAFLALHCPRALLAGKQGRTLSTVHFLQLTVLFFNRCIVATACPA